MRKLLALFLALAVIACADENPTDVGDALLPGGEVFTFEALLPASQFLAFDSAFTGYNQPADVLYGLVAHKFEGVVDARTLTRYSLPPRLIVVRTTGTTTVADSAPRFTGGRVVVRLDTLTMTPRPIRFSLYRTGEVWDVSATWTHRVDTAGVREPWATPGGTLGALIDTATWAAGDSVVFDVDSATLAVWNDSTDRARGAILVSDTDGSRAHVLSQIVRVDARSSLRADTVVNVDLVPTVRTFIINPIPPGPARDIRVGGVPSWRSFLRLRDDLRSLVLPCTGGPAGCRVTLDSVHVNKAELILQSKRTTPGWLPEDSIFIEARPISAGPNIPLERSPLGTFARQSAFRTKLLGPALFAGPATAGPVRIDITDFIVHQMDDAVEAGSRLPPVLVLMQIPETGTVGFATFEEAPMLRLILTTIEGR